MVVQEILVKSALTRSRIPSVTYCLNPYLGCQHGCRYCYAEFMRKFTPHQEPWGQFVDAKINIAEVLVKEVRRTKKADVSISTVTDPYQPLEKKYGLTRACLKILLEHQFPISILTKSPLVLRDLDLLKCFPDCEVGLTITTNDDQIRQIFEPHAPAIHTRLEMLRRLKAAGIRTYAFIGPILPMNPQALASQLSGLVDWVLVDRMNYAAKTRVIYKQHDFGQFLEDSYFTEVENILTGMIPGRSAYATSP